MHSKMLVAVAFALVSTGAFAADVKSVSRLAFGPDNILFVADWKGAQVHALALPAPVPRKGEGTWTESRYMLAVSGNLEDASGNRLNGHFESPGTAPEPTDADVYIPLTIDRALVTRKRRP